jgi:hypothetical protein
MENLVPAWSIAGTSALTEQDILPAQDVMSEAVSKLQEIGFGDELKRVSEDLLTLGGRLFLGTHTLEIFTGLNTSTPKPVYTVYLYDRTAGCFLIPYAEVTPDPAQPNQVTQVYPHSGDLSELAAYLDKPNASILLMPLYLPAGLGSGSEMRLVATTTGIVPGVFYSNSILVSWFDFEKREWHVTSLAKSFLESNYASLNSPQALQTNLTGWLDGTTAIPVDEVFEDNAGVPKKFNLFDRRASLESAPVLGTYGVLLGTQTVNDSLFAFMGFEDVNGTRYSLPFNLGKLSDPGCGTYFTALVSNLGQQHTYNDQSTYYACDLLRLILANYNNAPVALFFYDANWDALPSGALDPAVEQEYRAQQEYAAALAQFIYSRAFNPLGGQTFDGRVNLAPGDVNDELVPALFLQGISVKN